MRKGLLVISTLPAHERSPRQVVCAFLEPGDHGSRAAKFLLEILRDAPGPHCVARESGEKSSEPGQQDHALLVRAELLTREWADGWRQARRSKDELMKERDLYSIDEARERLGGISRNLIYEILRSGRLSSVVLGSRRFIPAAAITQLIAQSATTISPAEAAARSYIPTKQLIDISQRRPSQGR